MSGEQQEAERRFGHRTAAGRRFLPLRFASRPRLRHTSARLYLLLIPLLFFIACRSQPAALGEQRGVQVRLQADGELYNLTTTAGNVRELLDEAGVTVDPVDLVEPPPFTPLQDRMDIRVVRIVEEVDVVEETLPFDRQIVRSETMDAEEEPRIIQSGRSGRQTITVRVVYHDGIEVERQRTRVVVDEEPQAEIVMIGVGSSSRARSFPGTIAYIGGGNAQVLRSSTRAPATLDTGGDLDGRVFRLSPSGGHLLYTRALSGTERFNNSLWIVSLEPGARPRALGVENVLWADWNPARAASPQIAYTTGRTVDQPPGWEANNDLWLATIGEDGEALLEADQLVEAYPASYGWWGGNFAWSPDGATIAYSYADEVGVIDLDAPPNRRHSPLHRFTEYNTRADWVWVPTLTWSPEGDYLAFTSHRPTSLQGAAFDTWVVGPDGDLSGRFVEQAGMWSHPHWSPSIEDGESHIAFLQASDPLDSLTSTYTLWLMENDGSNRRQIYPLPGENSYFPRERQFMAWGSDGQRIAFIFDGDLYLLDVVTGEATAVTQGDERISRPTWAPYGAGISAPAFVPSVHPQASEPDAADPAALELPDRDFRGD
ncbi:MAG: ubiquitin-like domain-containing protein [Candidatus Promineifilaceae bacterium]|nr:ubiquitin-like domain-containing protein [Candidatus Promineifilaceae bacterium]